jgi:hypothetical protein
MACDILWSFFIFSIVGLSRFTPETIEPSAVGGSNIAGAKRTENRFGRSLHRATEVLFVTATSYISTLNIYCNHNNIWGYNKLFISPPWSSEAPPKLLPFTFRGHLTPAIIDFAHVAQNGVSRVLHATVSFVSGRWN